MPVITLPDGSSRSFKSPVSVLQVAEDIGPGLAKATLAGRVDGKLVDASFVIDNDASLAIITSRDADALELFRHDAAHVMAQAVQELFPGTQVTIGPAIEDGFYYDFARDEAFTPADLKKIEQRMHEIVKRDLAIQREEIGREEAMKLFAEMGEDYKVEIINDIIPEGEKVSIYRQGSWFDVCRGPHLPSTGKLGKAFKLMKLAGAYWRGDSNNEMLQRIYGTAWTDKKELNDYLHRLEEAEKFGVDHTINIEEISDPSERLNMVKKLTGGRGADLVFEGAGVPAAFAEAIDLVRGGGIMVEVGHYTDAGTVEVNPYQICYKDLKLISQYGFSFHQYDIALRQLTKWHRNGTYPLEDLVTHEYSIEKVEEGIKLHKKWETMKAVVLP